MTKRPILPASGSGSGRVRASRPSLVDKARKLMRGYRSDEDGALVVFSMFMLIGILVVTGLGLDLMRLETNRARVQATLDRAVLAAASKTQTRDPQVVVEDYFAAAGLSDNLDTVTVTEAFGVRTVNATASSRVSTSFLRLVGINAFNTTAAGAAKEAIVNLEVSVVLDISGSMGWNGKIGKLQVAANDFVDTVFDASDPGATSMSIVPYASQVNAGADLLAQYTTTGEHSYNNCVDFNDADFTTTALATDQLLQRSGHFDPWSPYSWGTTPYYRVCRTDAGTAITPLSGDRLELKDAIDALSAGGNTSLEIGMKWGSALLDAGTQPVVSNLVGLGVVDSTFMDRPDTFGQDDAMKVIVLMTDGQNTTEYVLKDGVRDGLSDVWYDVDTGRFSIWGSPDEDNGWGAAAVCNYGDAFAEDDPCQDWGFFTPHNHDWNAAPTGTDPKRLTYPELWALSSVSGHAYMRYQMTGDASDYYGWKSVYDAVEPADKNARTLAICEAAKNAGIMVYTIGFEVTDYSAGLLETCATSPSHNFRVEGVDINYAFQAIAGSINVLRLTK